MTSATDEQTTAGSAPTARSALMAATVLAALSLSLVACGGGDDAAIDADVTTTVVPVATTTTAAPTTTVAPATTTTTISGPVVVTDGAVVVVANASSVNGAAGRLTDRLAVLGYDMADATNSADSVSNLGRTQIYFDPETEGAEAVAESIKSVFGGGSIEVLAITIPALTKSGDMGEASVLVLMGNDVADRSFDELQGLVPATTAASTDGSSGD